MRYQTWILLLLLIAAAGCNLGRDGASSDDLDDQPLPTLEASGKPSVIINSPENGDEFVVNDPVLISVNAADTVGVTSVQLRANNQIVRTVASESISGDTNKSVLLDYTPRTTGDIRFDVVAFRGSVQSDVATVNVSVRQTQSQVTSTPQVGNNLPDINPNDPTCRALVNIGLNFRRGPGISFDIIRVLGAGEVLPINGRLADNTWWQLNSGTSVGWVDARFVTIYGNCSGIAVVSGPVTPTIPAATLTAAPTSTPQPQPTAVPPATATPGPANLIVSNITGPSEVVIPAGQTSVSVQYGVSITNNGGLVEKQFSSIARILPTGTTFDVGVVANLATNQSINLIFNVTFSQTGTFALEVVADSGSQIAESDEGDNSRVFNVTVKNQ